MKLLIHGGFFSESDQSTETKLLKQSALEHIIRTSWNYLQTHSALETAAYAVAQLEDDPLFNAGTGSQIQSDGTVRMSAALMDGSNQMMTGVINIENVRNPILVAHSIMNEKLDDRILSGAGAKDFAREAGYGYYNPKTPQREIEYLDKKKSLGRGTVGCVVLDREGKLAAGTSTGGKGFEIPGRVSDSATVAGNYANQHAAVSCTGVGEDIVSNATAVKIVTRVTDGNSVEQAVERTFRELEQFDGFAGAIVLDSTGKHYYKDSHPKMVFACFDGDALEIFS